MKRKATFVAGLTLGTLGAAMLFKRDRTVNIIGKLLKKDN